MPSVLNQLIYKETEKVFSDNSSIILIDYTTFTQKDSVAMRDSVKPNGMSARVIKNSVASKVLVDKGIEGVEALFAGQVMALVGNDPVELSKAASQFFKANKKGEPVGGIVDGKLVTKEEVIELSKLPSRETLVGMFVNVVASPIQGFVTVLDANIRGLATVMNAIKEKKEKAA
jgi:large subunit ribosomal protein L10